MGIFRNWLIEDKKYDNFRKEVHNLIIESFDSHAEIIKTELKDGFKFYYFNINENRFRVILEVVDDETGINFEQFLNEQFTPVRLSNNLGAKEVMLLFGTIIYIINKYAITRHFSVFTDNGKKFRTYLKILTTRGIKNIRYHFILNNTVAQIQFTLDENESWLDRKVKKFKYKFV